MAGADADDEGDAGDVPLELKDAKAHPGGILPQIFCYLSLLRSIPPFPPKALSPSQFFPFPPYNGFPPLPVEILSLLSPLRPFSPRDLPPLPS